jgi:hypothetical protein
VARRDRASSRRPCFVQETVNCLRRVCINSRDRASSENSACDQGDCPRAQCGTGGDRASSKSTVCHRRGPHFVREQHISSRRPSESTVWHRRKPCFVREHSVAPEETVLRPKALCVTGGDRVSSENTAYHPGDHARAQCGTGADCAPSESTVCYQRGPHFVRDTVLGPRAPYVTRGDRASSESTVCHRLRGSQFVRKHCESPKQTALCPGDRT